MVVLNKGKRSVRLHRCSHRRQFYPYRFRMVRRREAQEERETETEDHKLNVLFTMLK